MMPMGGVSRALQERIWDADLEKNLRDMLLLLSLFSKADGTDIFPSQALLAQKSNLSEKQVWRLLNELRQKGYIELVSGTTGQGLTQRHRIVMEALKPRERKDNTRSSDSKRRTFLSTGHSEAIHRTFLPRTPDISGTTPDIQMSDKQKKEQESETYNRGTSAWDVVSASLKEKAAALRPQIGAREPDPTRIDTQRYKTYISTLHAVSMKGDMLILEVPHAPFAAMVERFKPRILEAAKECGAGFTDLKFVIRSVDF